MGKLNILSTAKMGGAIYVVVWANLKWEKPTCMDDVIGWGNVINGLSYMQLHSFHGIYSGKVELTYVIV